MKKKIKQVQGTFGETYEIEELTEETFDTAEPFEIEEIVKINDIGMKKNKKKSDALLLSTEVVNKSPDQKMNKKYIEVLEEELKLMTKITNENKDQLEKYKSFNLSLNKQSAKLTERNAQLENDFNTVSKELNQKKPDKEFQSKLDIIYKQQNIIKDYEDQISKLKEENQLLEQNTELPPSWLTGDLKFNSALKNDTNNDTNQVSEGLNQQENGDELKTKSKFIYEQQNIIKDYEDKISKLKDENQLLEQNSKKIIDQEENKDAMEDLSKRIKYYQDDNLRLSNELVKLSNKLENTKNQLEYYENNKARLMSQLENLNNIISESNVIGSPFNNTISKIDDKLSIDDKPTADEKKPNEKQIKQNKFQPIIRPGRVKNSETINRLTKEIFKK